jgi:CheY-like chemotaxis protein
VTPHVSPVLVVVCGPPLPGRRAFGRALTHQLGAEHRLRCVPSEVSKERDPAQRLLDEGACVVIEGEFATLRERQSLLSSLITIERLLVEWMCPRAEAEREIFHRFAGRAPARAEAELARYLEDERRREPISELEAPAVVRIGARAPLGDQVLAVVAALGPRPLVSPAPPRRLRVLVVERHEEERTDLAETLRELGCQVLCAPDGTTARNLLMAGAAIELAFIGDQLADIEGPELVLLLEQMRPDVRAVLLMSRYASRRVPAIPTSAIEVLEKPAHFVDLERLLEEASL